MSSLKYLKRWKSLQRMASGQCTALSNAAADYEGGGIRTVSMFSKLMSQGSSFVMEGVKNLVVKKHNLPVTKIIEELMEVREQLCLLNHHHFDPADIFFQIRQGQHQEEFLYFDPKILRGGDNVPRAKNPFQEAVVFMVGGGNYIEYQNLMDYAGGGPAAGGGGGLGATPKASSANLVATAAAAAASSSSGSSSKRIIYGCTTLVNSNQVRKGVCPLM